MLLRVMMGKVERACRDVFRYAMNKHEQYQCGMSACFSYIGQFPSKIPKTISP